MSFWVWWVLALLAAAGPATLPFPLDASEAGSLIATDKDGQRRWQADWSMEAETTNGQQFVRLSERGQGVYSPFTQQVRWTVEAWWQAGPPFQPSRVEKHFTDLQGNLLLSRKAVFDWKAGRASVEVRRGSQKAEVETIPVSPGTWTPEGMAIALRQMDFTSDGTLKARLLSDEPKVYEVRFKKVGRETVDTPEGPVECYKLRMEADLGVMSLFKFLIPDTYFWFAVAPPHMWVRYQGLESGRGTPQVTRKMASFTRHQD